MKKNNNLTFTQFLTRQRWMLVFNESRPPIFESFKERFSEAADNSHEFLTTEEMDYVNRLFSYLEQLGLEWSGLKDKLLRLGADRETTKAVYRKARSEVDDLQKKLKFCYKYKFNPEDRNMPDSVRTAVSAVLLRALSQKKILWTRSSQIDRGYVRISKRINAPWDATKVRLFRMADQLGALTMSDRDAVVSNVIAVTADDFD